MRKIPFFFSVSLCAMAPVLPAMAQTDRVIQAVKAGAWAQVLAERCTSLKVNWLRYGGLMRQAGLQPEDIEPTGKHGKLHAAFLAEALSETRTASEAVSCASGRSLYGPNGRNVPRLLAPNE